MANIYPLTRKGKIVGHRTLIKGKWHYLSKDKEKAQEKFNQLTGETKKIISNRKRLIRSFLKRLRCRVKGKQISYSYYRQQYWNLRAIYKFIPKDISVVTGKIITSIHNDILRWKKSTATKNNCIKTLRMFIGYGQDIQKVQVVCNIAKLTRIKTERKPLKFFDVEELRTIWNSLNQNNHKMWFLLACNCGFTQSDIIHLTTDNINNGELSMYRHKTGAFAKYRLWGTTQKYLDISSSKPTKDGISVFWTRLKVRLPFKYIRKTIANMIRAEFGLEIAQMYLAHSPSSIAEIHYTSAPVAKLFLALDWVENELMLTKPQTDLIKVA